MYRVLHFIILSVLAFPFLSANGQNENPKPVLVVQIVIEQMRVDMIDRYWNRFSEKGFKRLINQGAFCRNASYDYMVTESAPGYATLSTGNNPSGHGIISDTWYEKLTAREQFCVSDPTIEDKPAFGKKNKYSPKQLLGSGLGDELRMSNYKLSKVISISDKPYASVLMASHLGNAAYWIDDDTGEWTTSPYYMDSVPAWVSDFNKKQFAPYYLTREWNTENTGSAYKESLADNNSYETGFSNKQKTFPYRLSEIKAKEGSKLIRYTPFGNTYIVDFSVAAILNEHLGKDNYPDLLTISFGATGNVCDLFGIRSVELEDLYIRLDKDIAHLLEVLDDRFGKENVLVVLTSDRGASDNIEYMSEIGMPVGKFYPDKTLLLLESFLKGSYGFSNWVKFYSNKQIYLNDLTLDKSKIPAGEVQMKAAQFLSQFQAIANVSTAYAMQTGNFTSGDLQRFQNSYNMARSGDILISLKPGWVEFKNGKKTTESEEYNAYRYGSHVPLIFYGCSIKNKTIENHVSMADVAPTIARILGIPFPNDAKGSAIDTVLDE